MTRYAIGFGSNVGDRLGHLERAHAGLALLGSDLAVSPLYETAPVGGPDQGPYLNAVVVLESDLTPDEVLARLHEIERREGREREVRWGPRTLDLDIVASDGPPQSAEELTVPHPRAAEREFVLRPLAEVWPDATVAAGVAAADALTEVGDQGVDLLARQWLPPRPKWPADLLVAGQLGLVLTVMVVLWLDGNLPRTLTAMTLVGALLTVLGLGLSLLAARHLGVGLTASPIPRPGAPLVESGPFRYARHPIYGGISLMAIGASLFLGSLRGVTVGLLLLVYLWLKSVYEERQLRIRFADYRAYRETVTRRLVPFVI